MTLALHPAPHLGETRCPHGLGALVGPEPFPLKDVRVRSRIAAGAATTVVEQRFANPFKQPLEATYIFPLPAQAAVVAMSLRAGELVVEADLRERGEAEAAFAEARRQGHRAALLTAERDDVHTLRATRIPPGEEVVVRVELVEQLESIDGRLHFRFPTVIAPRYMPGTAIGHEGPGVSADTDHAPDASRLSPPLRLAGGTRLDLEVEVAGRVRVLESSLHAVRVESGDVVRVAPSGKATCDRDFVLAIAFGEPDAAVVRAVTDGVATMVLVEPPLADPGPPLPRDAVFVVDISGSMSGEKLQAAKKALVAALHGLVPGDRFALVAFDDRVERFAADFTAVDDRAVARGDAWIGRLHARGGTLMLPAIEAALSGTTPAGRLRTVLFVTDGQAGNDAELVAAVAGRRQGARFFTLGVDTAVNDTLLRRLARVGGGVCELLAPGDDVESAMARLEARFGLPLLDEVRVDGGADGEALFAGRAAVLYLDGSPASVTVRANGPGGPREWSAAPERTEVPVARLAARQRIARLEDRIAQKPWEEEAIRAEVLRLALSARLASRYTAWLAVERTRRVDGTLAEVVQPVELPHAWSETVFLSAPAGASAPMPVMCAGAPAPSVCAEAAPRQRSGGLLKAVGRLFQSRAPGVDECTVDPTTGDAGPAYEAHRPAAPSPARPSAPPPPPADAAGDLARTQAADGSWGGDLRRTVAALLALLLLGHTRQRGLRRRAVQKAHGWLAARPGEPLAVMALAAVARAEAGEALSAEPAWRELHAAGAEGAALASVTTRGR
jgi:Ca-activated chloride channel family protein